LTIDATSGLVSLYTENSGAVGTHIAAVTASLARYPSIPAVTATFQITIEPCYVTSFTMADLSPTQDKTYYI